MIANTPDNLRAQLGLSNFNLFYPATYLPSPTKSDYDYGFITRYFVGKRNQQSIIETCARDYSLTDPNMFLLAKCDWQITGPKTNVYSGTTLQMAGVSEYNIIQIATLKKALPGIENILVNPLQFWAGY